MLPDLVILHDKLAATEFFSHLLQPYSQKTLTNAEGRPRKVTYGNITYISISSEVPEITPYSTPVPFFYSSTALSIRVFFSFCL